jgi:hypothetical protein
LRSGCQSLATAVALRIGSVNPGSFSVNPASQPTRLDCADEFIGIITRSLQADMQAELRDLERAVAAGTRDAGRGLRTELRRQVASAGLGQRLANSCRDKHYLNQQIDAAGLVYTKAPQIVRAFDEGAVIRSRRGRFLAVPTENAPKKGTDGRRISPSTFPEHRFGLLRFVPRPSGPSLLVVDGCAPRSTGKLANSEVSGERPSALGAAAAV